MVKVSQIQIKKNAIKESLDSITDTKQVALVWLGQAGFAFRYKNHLGLIDPYLSDFLAQKYKNTELPHRRMMPPPILPEQIRNVELVLCTHRHSDHMDPGTLPIVANNNPSCLFIIPRAEREWAIHIGVPEKRIHSMNAGEKFPYDPEVHIQAVAAAHEELKMNEKGEHHFLGYIFKLEDIKLYHSGDCAPYSGLEDKLKKSEIDVALLPINGRDEYRRRQSIPGNFSFSEAYELCRKCNIPVMIAHHFGMFEFNTVDVEEVRNQLKNLKNSLQCFLPQTDIMYVVSK